jgi:PadR family transcriptional regulator, regulatory protein AphA
MSRSKNPLSLEFVLLGFITQGPIHGYDLYKKLCDPDGIALIWRVKQSYLYAMLDKLEKDGMLTSRTIERNTFPSRKEFQITGKGRDNFHYWLTSPVQHGREMRQEFLAKLYFAQSTSSVSYRDLKKAQLKICHEWISAIESELTQLSGQQNYAKIILNYRISQTQAMLEWLKQLK